MVEVCGKKRLGNYYCCYYWGTRFFFIFILKTTTAGVKMERAPPLFLSGWCIRMDGARWLFFRLDGCVH
jgi:hypothetical protein